jgi:hypothetical protein
MIFLRINSTGRIAILNRNSLRILNDRRKRKHSLRTVINAIFPINNTGVQMKI